MTLRVAIVTSHVIQYQDPLFRLAAADPALDLTVFFCSGDGAETYHDADMKTTLRWDIEMLSGYRHVFLRNLSPVDLNGGFWRLINPGIVPAIARGKFDLVIFMLGWGSLTAWLGIIACRFFRVPFAPFGDSSFPPPETTWRARLRRGVMRTMFGLADAFMVSGKLNADYYEHYGADRSRFFLLPWAVDNARFEAASHVAPGEREALRAAYGIAPDVFVAVYSAKLVARKDPLTLLRAYDQMRERKHTVILFLGDGELRDSLERYTREHHLEEGVRFAGFINQTDLPKQYALGDVFVLPSLIEPRGAVINEAMACGLPVIVTDRCGSIGDIVQEGDNAFIYPAGDATTLASQLDALAADPALRNRMARRSREIIATWDFARGVEGIKSAARAVSR
jgi:glycosyltransferase involved in cell wall biosynthesis